MSCLGNCIRSISNPVSWWYWLALQSSSWWCNDGMSWLKVRLSDELFCWSGLGIFELVSGSAPWTHMLRHWQSRFHFLWYWTTEWLMVFLQYFLCESTQLWWNWAWFQPECQGRSESALFWSLSLSATTFHHFLWTSMMVHLWKMNRHWMIFRRGIYHLLCSMARWIFEGTSRIYAMSYFWTISSQWYLPENWEWCFSAYRSSRSQIWYQNCRQ